jgi:hypothetical protein
MIDKNELIKLLPKLIKENDEIRGAVISALSGVISTKDDLKVYSERMDKSFKELIKQMDKRFESMQEQMDKRFESMQEQMDKRFESMQEQMDKRFEAVDKRFEELIQLMDKRFEAVDKRFERMLEQMDRGFEEARKERSEIKTSISTLGMRAGFQLEKAILDLLNDKIIQKNINISKIKKVELVDKEGKIFYKNFNTDIDVLIENGNRILIEIKFKPDNRDIFHLMKTAELYRYQTGKDYDSLMIICMEITQRNFQEATKQGISVIAGEISNS